MKKILCLILSLLMALQCTAFFAYAVEGKTPILSYSFEDSSDAPTLFGNAELVYDEDLMSNVLSLDGTEGTYAEITQGFFDGRDVMTIQFDILPNEQWGNFFTFCFGADNIKYSFFKIKNEDNEDKKLIRNCITTSSWQNEQYVDYKRENYNGWMHIALVYDNTTLKLYIDGNKVDEEQNTGLKVSDLGSNLYSYLGKSLYNGDGWFNGCFDNFEVYDCALSDSEIAQTAEANLPEAMASLRYTFEDGTTLPTLSGNATTVYNDEHGSKVLSLDGTDGTYAEITQGLFDNKNEMTILFDIKPGTNSGNFFTFAFGRNSTYYDFFRIRGSEIRNAITVNSYNNEREVKTSSESTDGWMTIALVFDNGKCQLYVNGTLKDTNNNAHSVSELGTNLSAYFGKSFYSGDGYFNGLFDNFEVYEKVLSADMIENKAKAHLPLLLSVNVGEVVSNLDGVSGTDSHTMISTSINRENGEITSIIQRRQDPEAVPVNFISLNDGCVIYVDNEEFTNNSTLDLTYDRNVRIVHGETAEEYTLKASQIANNPILPGMYADPDIDIFDGKFWIYPTTDGVPGWGGTQFHAFSSEDMETWTDEGVILDNKDKNPGLNDKGIQIASCSWSNGNAWAPSIEKKNGKYYFYFCGNILSEYESTYGKGMAIGVAYADSPAGPYTASDTPILYPKMVSDANIGYSGQVIDPAVYTEGETSYLLFGNGNAAIAELNSDMLTVKTSTLRKLEGLEGFRESVAVFKRNGVYYWHWSCDDTGSENYHIRYGTSTSLTGTITYRGVLVEKDPENGILATGHQSVIYIPETDKCFIAYHRFYTPLSIGGNVGHHRETCVDEITFSRNIGSVDLLNKVTPTMAGVGKVDINGVSLNNYDATSLENKKLEWDFGLTPSFSNNSVGSTYGNSTMNLVYWGSNTYYYDGSNGLRTNDGYTYIENIAEKLEDGKDIDITFRMITNDRYNDREAGAFAIGSQKGTGDGECEFNDLLYLKNDGTMLYRGAGSTEDIRAGAVNGVSQGEHTYRIYFRYSTKTISVYQDGKLIGFRQDNSLSKSRFNFLALGVWRNTYFGKNTIEKLTISQPDIKDSGYINKDNLVSDISKQSVSQDIGYGALETVIDEINSSDFQTSFADVKANENLYTPSSLKNYYAALNRVKIFDASSAVYDYSNNATVSGAADEVASIVGDFNSYKTPDLRADLSGLQKAFDKADSLLRSLNEKAAQYDADSINALITAVNARDISTYLNSDEKTRAEYGRAVQENANALEEAINSAIASLKLSVDDSTIDTSAYEAAVAIVNNPDPDAYILTDSITSARSTANTLVGTSTIKYGASTIHVFNTETNKKSVDDATNGILSALSSSVKTYTVQTEGVSETTFKKGTAEGTSSPYTATYGTTVTCQSDDGETAWYTEISSGTSHRKEQFQGYGRGLEIKVVGNMIIKAVKPSATTSQVKIVREYSDAEDNKYPAQLVDYVTTQSYFTLPSAPALAYYSFEGYYINGVKYTEPTVQINSDTEIIARYISSGASCAINATDINENIIYNSSVNYNTKVSLEGGSGAYGWLEDIGDNKFRPFYIGENVDFFASESTNLKAVGADDFRFSTPCINLRKNGVIISDTKTIFNAQLFDAGREIKEYGILIGTGDITANDLVIENSGTHENYRVIRAKSTRLVGANQFAISVKGLSDGYSYRGYVIYENSDKEFVTEYTEIR